MGHEQVAALDRPRLVLASASPARLRTLRGAGLDPEVVVSDVDEEGISAGTPAETALLLARLKAFAVADRLAATAAPGTLVLGCDTLLELDGQALGKPGGAAEAVARWQQMRGRSGALHTGHCLVQLTEGRNREVTATATTGVHFADVSDDEIEAYAGSGEPLAVAGAFTLDGLGGAFVTGVTGDHHNVVGVSLPLLRRLLIDLGIAWPRLWARS